jgi:penicillin V acylase-like amidase (Ntn superfamily)
MCTAIRFTDGRGSMYFGRNLDWGESYGERVVVTPRGFTPPAAFEASRPTEHAVIGMGIVAEGMPLYFDCANEAGLAVAGLNFPGFACYEAGPVSDRRNIAAYEFPLWVTGRFRSVEEVTRALEDVAIVAKPVNDSYPISLLHWLIGDAGCSVVVECTESGVHVYDDEVDVLTNQPEFCWHRENLRNYLALSSGMPQTTRWREAELSPFGTGFGMQGLPGGYSSAARFVRAADLNAHYPEKETERENVTRLFRTLLGASMVEGAASMADGSFEKTLYTGGFSTRTNTYYYATYDDPAIRAVSLDEQSAGADDLLIVE